MNAFFFFVPAIPASCLAMKVGQLAKVKFDDRLILENWDNKHLLQGAVIFATSASLYFYWPSNLSVMEAAPIIRRWKRQQNLGHRLINIFSRFAPIAAGGVAAVALLKIENPQHRMLACGSAMAIQALVFYVTPKGEGKN